jgi:hypothetical protein
VRVPRPVFQNSGSGADWRGAAARMVRGALLSAGEMLALSAAMLDEAIDRASNGSADPVSANRLGAPACPRQVVDLVYELLDAHDDTTRLAPRALDRDPVWLEHLDYIRHLQRVGREALAHAPGERP